MAGLREPLGEAGTVKMGPFVSDADAKTPLTNLSIVQSDVKISKNNGPFAQKSDATTATHDENGWYDIPVNGDDILSNGGSIVISIAKSGALPVWRKFSVSSPG